MLVNGIRTKCMVKEFFIIQTILSLMMVNGSKTSFGGKESSITKRSQI